MDIIGRKTVSKWSLLYIVLLMMISQSWTVSREPNLDSSVAAFSAKVYQFASRQHSDNILICPVSVQTILALLMSGAMGRTGHQMSSALILPQEDSTISYFFKLLENIQRYKSSKLELIVANRIFARKTFMVSPDFRTSTLDFDADIEAVDFKKSQPAANKINSWVAKRTKNKINNLITPTDITPATQLILINALYFDGKWARAFDPKQSIVDTFYTTDGQPTAAYMMSQKAKMRYADAGEIDCKIIEIPYDGFEYMMTIALPNRIDGLRDLEDHLEELMAVIKTELYTAEVNVTMPRFDIEDKLNYNDILKQLGMVEAFGDRADFRNIGSGGERISISSVVSKTYISVTEEGTIAAAASAIGAVTLSIPSPVPKVSFIVDHPFMFFITTRRQGTPIFMGRVVQPMTVTQQFGLSPNRPIKIQQEPNRKQGRPNFSNRFGQIENEQENVKQDFKLGNQQPENVNQGFQAESQQPVTLNQSLQSGGQQVVNGNSSYQFGSQQTVNEQRFGYVNIDMQPENQQPYNTDQENMDRVVKPVPNGPQITPQMYNSGQKVPGNVNWASQSILQQPRPQNLDRTGQTTSQQTAPRNAPYRNVEAAPLNKPEQLHPKQSNQYVAGYQPFYVMRLIYDNIGVRQPVQLYG